MIDVACAAPQGPSSGLFLKVSRISSRHGCGAYGTESAAAPGLPTLVVLARMRGNTGETAADAVRAPDHLIVDLPPSPVLDARGCRVGMGVFSPCFAILLTRSMRFTSFPPLCAHFPSRHPLSTASNSDKYLNNGEYIPRPTALIKAMVERYWHGFCTSK
jgi:uncharacterized protein YceK